MIGVRADNMSFSYDDSSPKVLSDLSFDISVGQIVWLRGPNGSGKSTLLRLVAREVDPTIGLLSIEGRVGYLPDEVHFFDELTLSEHLSFLTTISKGIFTQAAADKWGLDSSGVRNKFVKDLSLGWRKRFALAALFSQEQDILLLDEPYSGLDVEAKETLDDHLRSHTDQGGIVFLSSHTDPEKLASARIDLDS